MRQQVDCDLVVVFDDEATAGEHPAGQLMSHLKHSKSVKSGSLKVNINIMKAVSVCAC